MPKTIDEIAYAQSGSDIFFNDERVCSVYSAIHADEDTEMNEENFAAELHAIHGFDKDDALVIAQDFLKRV